MIITFLVMKLTLEGILKECNRIASEQNALARNSYLKSRLARLEIDYYKGLIDVIAYQKGQSEILAELDSISRQKSDNIGGDASLEF
jgi:hypothetical protein